MASHLFTFEISCFIDLVSAEEEIVTTGNPNAAYDLSAARVLLNKLFKVSLNGRVSLKFNLVVGE